MTAMLLAESYPPFFVSLARESGSRRPYAETFARLLKNPFIAGDARTAPSLTRQISSANAHEGLYGGPIDTADDAADAAFGLVEAEALSLVSDLLSSRQPTRGGRSHVADLDMPDIACLAAALRPTLDGCRPMRDCRSRLAA